MSTQRRRPNVNPSPKAVPVARVVALPPGTKPKSLAKPKRFPWIATAAVSVTATLVALMIWLSGHSDLETDSRVADHSAPAPNLAPSVAADEAAEALPSTLIARVDQRDDENPVSASVDQVTSVAQSQPKEAAVENPFDAGSLDVSLLKALEPEQITETGRFAEESAGVQALVLCADGRLAASGGEDGTIRLWDVETRQLSRQLAGHTAAVQCLAFAADGGRLISGDADRTVRVWDVASGGETQRLNGHRAAVSGVAFAADGRSIYSAGADGSLKKWDSATGKVVQSLDGGVGFTKLAINPSGDAILAGGWDGSVFLWDGSSPTWTHPVASADADSLNSTPFPGGPPPTGGPFRKHAAGIVR